MYIIIIAIAVFGLCFALDKGFTKLFRGKPQHKTGLSVRLSKRYGSIGLILLVLGLASVFYGLSAQRFLIVAGAIVILMGITLVVFYLSFGIYYDSESFILSTFGRKSRTYAYRDILCQQLYNASGNIVIELHLQNGSCVSLQSTMSGVYPFLDTAFSGWCRQKGIDAGSCDFHDPANSLWFPQEEV